MRVRPQVCFFHFMETLMRHSLARLFSVLCLIAPAHAQSDSDFKLRVIAPSAGITNVGIGTSINKEGIMAFTANDTSGSRAWVGRHPRYVDGTPATLQVVSSIVGPTRTFSGIGLTSGDDPYLVARELVSGAPPATLIRRWRVNDSSNIILGSSVSAPIDFDSVTSLVDINNNLYATGVGLVGGSTQTRLFLGTSRPLGQLYTTTGIALLRPHMADNLNRLVVREADGTIATWDASGARSVVLGAGNDFAIDLATTGNRPGISPDGLCVGFTGTNGNGPGVFVSWLPSGGGARRFATVAGGTLGDGFSAFTQDQRVGVLRMERTADRWEAMIAFVGTRNGVPGAYVRRLEVRDDLQIFTRSEVSTIARIGDEVPGLSGAITNVSLYDPMSECGAIGLSVSTSAGTAVVRADPGKRSSRLLPTAPLHSQASGPWAPLCLKRGFSPPNCPLFNGYQVTFQRSGCTVTAFATAVGLELDRIGAPTQIQRPDPLVIRNIAQDAGIVTGARGEVNAAKLFYEASDIRVVSERTSDSTFDTVIAELKQGRPLILAVPSRTRTVAQTKQRELHYVVAYGFDEQVAVASGAAMGILISDPGNGASAYSCFENANCNSCNGTIPAAGFVPQTAPRHVTLHDYFAAISRRSATPCGGNAKLDYFGIWGSCPARDMARIRDWFDRGVFFRLDNQGQTVEEQVTFTQEFPLWNLITKIRSAPRTAVLYPPTVGVASPVELVLTDPVDGIRYVSAPSLAMPGDVVLAKHELPPVSNEEEPDGSLEPTFPSYFVELPLSLYGRQIEYSIIGVGNGPYTVTYGHRGLDFIPPQALSGTIVAGETISGTFIPSAAGPTCDSIDINNDGSFFDPQDVDAFLSVFSEGPCVPDTAVCGDLDFNNDGSVFDPCDVDSFLTLFSEGPCTLCGV